MQKMTSPSHVGHRTRIDVFRQSLMCSTADTTLEIKEEQFDGVHGFGFLHRCGQFIHCT